MVVVPPATAALVALGCHEQGLADLNRSLELRPNDPTTRNNRGTALHDLGRPEEALADYNRTLELGPDDAATLNNRGAALSKLGRHEEGLDVLDGAILGDALANHFPSDAFRAQKVVLWVGDDQRGVVRVCFHFRFSSLMSSCSMVPKV